MGNRHKKIDKEKSKNSNKNNKENLENNDNNNPNNEKKNNFYKDKFKFVRFLNEHNRKVINVSLLNDGRICTCHEYDIYIYNKYFEFELIIPLGTCHYQIQLKNNLLVTGSGAVNIIELKSNNTYSEIQNIPEEASILSIIEYLDSNFIIGLQNGDIKIYKMNQKTKLYENTSKFSNKINSLVSLCLINKHLFASAFSDIHSVKFYDYMNEEISLRASINNIQCGANHKTTCLFNDILIVGGQRGIAFYLIDLKKKKFQILSIIKGFKILEVNSIIKLKHSNKILVGLLPEGTLNNLYKFKYENNELIKTKELAFSFDFDVIYGIAELDDTKICYGSYNGKTIIVQ